MQGEEKEIVVNPPGREALRLAYDLIVAHILPRMLGEKEGDEEIPHETGGQSGPAGSGGI